MVVNGEWRMCDICISAMKICAMSALFTERQRRQRRQRTGSHQITKEAQNVFRT